MHEVKTAKNSTTYVPRGLGHYVHEYILYHTRPGVYVDWRGVNGIVIRDTCTQKLHLGVVVIFYVFTLQYRPTPIKIHHPIHTYYT